MSVEPAVALPPELLGLPVDRSLKVRDPGVWPTLERLRRSGRDAEAGGDQA